MLRTRAPLPALAALLLLGPAAALGALDPPVVTLSYETAQGIEEDDEEDLQPAYLRHTVAARIRQELGESARFTLPLRLTSRPDPQDSAAPVRSAVSVQPRLDFDLTDRLDLGTELIVRRSADPVLLTAGGRLQSRLRAGDLALDGWVKPLFDSYIDQPERNRQLYTASVGVTYSRDAVRLSTRYRGTARFAFGDASEVETRFSHLMNVSLRLDLAKLD